MFTILFSIGAVALTTFALWYASRGESSPTVVGSGNAFEAYYGKNRWDPGQSPPCEQCGRTGCIGAGSCYCNCHRPFRKKK